MPIAASKLHYRACPPGKHLMAASGGRMRKSRRCQNYNGEGGKQAGKKRAHVKTDRSHTGRCPLPPAPCLWQVNGSQAANGYPGMRFTQRNLLVAALMVPVSFGIGLIVWKRPDTAVNADLSAEIIEQGRQRYADNCASCHGAALEGQPDWQMPLASGRLPAPPHDASGHTWHHGDELLFRIVRDGTAAVVGGNYESDMPGFGDVLNDAEIRAVLAYIKSTWPEPERAYQTEMSRREN